MPGTAQAEISKQLTVGVVAARSGVAVSTVHFYEAQGLIKGTNAAIRGRCCGGLP